MPDTSPILGLPIAKGTDPLKQFPSTVDSPRTLALEKFTVPRFANAAARTAAIPAPVEGMTTWLNDVKRTEVWLANAWRATGPAGELVAAFTGLTVPTGAPAAPPSYAASVLDNNFFTNTATQLICNKSGWYIVALRGTITGGAAGGTRNFMELGWSTGIRHRASYSAAESDASVAGLALVAAAGEWFQATIFQNGAGSQTASGTVTAHYLGPRII